MGMFSYELGSVLICHFSHNFSFNHFCPGVLRSYSLSEHVFWFFVFLNSHTKINLTKEHKLWKIQTYKYIWILFYYTPKKHLQTTHNYLQTDKANKRAQEGLLANSTKDEIPKGHRQSHHLGNRGGLHPESSHRGLLQDQLFWAPDKGFHSATHSGQISALCSWLVWCGNIIIFNHRISFLDTVSLVVSLVI